MLISVSNSSVNQPAVIAERITFAASHHNFLILVVFVHSARLGCGEGGVLLSYPSSDLLHFRPFTQT